MEDLLTTRQLMDMLQLDRTTIYRMLNDGRLPGVRVGGQWRFSRPAIETWLQGQQPSAPPEAPEAHPSPPPDPDVLPLNCLQPIQEVFAQTAGIGSLTTDLAGELLIECSNPCAFCNLVLGSPKGRARCQASWKRLSEPGMDEPWLEACHAGLAYARGRITVQGDFVAMIFGGQFLIEDSLQALAPDRLARLADACEVDQATLGRAAREIPVLKRARAEQLLRLLQLVANTFSNIGQERYELMKRLEKVALIASGVSA